MSQNRPNIVFLFSDQQRYDTVSCYGAAPGASFGLTPRIDRLAEEGVRFDLAMTCQPVCGPARACLQTGLYPDGIGCPVNDRALPAGIPTIADRLNEAGYETAYVGKWHLASNRSFASPPLPDSADYKTKPVPPERRGGWRDYWMAADVLEFTSHGYGGYVYDGDGRRVEFDGYRADFLADCAADYIRREKRGPFCLFVSWLEPHYQNDREHCEAPEGWRERYERYVVPGDLEGTAGDWRKEMPDYLACCRSLDENAGRIFDALKETGAYENTLIVYTSDHGCHFRTRNGEYKRSAHDASLHVPLVIRGPGFTGGKPVRQLTSLIDLPPTLLEAAGIPIPPEFPGLPLQRLAARPDIPLRDEVYVQISEAGDGRAIRTKTHTICAMFEGTSLREAYVYDNTADPYQRRNLAGLDEYAVLRRELRDHLEAAILREEGKRISVAEA
jgi:uncharacterized sulfatase